MAPAELGIGVLLPMWTGALDGATPTMRQVLDYARYAETVGLDSVWTTDHLYFEAYTDFRAVGIQLPDQYAGIMGGQWECWTTAAAVAACTRRVAVGTLVTNTGFRNPALLARMADTVEDLSEGRLILGLGAGDFATEHHAYGFDFAHHVSRFEDALAILKPMLRGEKVTHAGAHYRAHDAELLPKSTTGRVPPILIGTLQGKPRMSRLVAQYADHWNSMIAFNDCSVETYRRAWAPIAAACEQYDRDPATLVRGATVAVNLTDGPYTIMPTSVPFAGSNRQIADRFAEYAEQGAGHVSVIPHPWNERGLERLGEIVEELRRWK